MTATATQCIETAIFKLKPGATDAQLMAVEARIRDGAIQKQAGYISRELAKDEASGEWLMVMRFDTRANMDAWMLDLKKVPEMRDMGALIDMGSMVMRFFNRMEP